MTITHYVTCKAEGLALRGFDPAPPLEDFEKTTAKYAADRYEDIRSPRR